MFEFITDIISSIIDLIIDLISNLHNFLITNDKIINVFGLILFSISFLSYPPYGRTTYIVISISSIILLSKVICSIIIAILKTINIFIINLKTICKIFGIVICTFFCFVVFLLLSYAISMSCVQSYLFNNHIYEDSLFIIFISLLITLPIMSVFSLIYDYIYMKFFYNKIAIAINEFIFTFLVTILFTAIIGLKSTLAKYITLRIGPFYDVFQLNVEDYLNILIYWFFTSTLCFQLVHKIMNKLITKNNSCNLVSKKDD